MPTLVTETAPARKRRIMEDDDNDDAYSSSSASFQSPDSSVNGDGDDDDFLPADDIRSKRGGIFALPTGDSQDDSVPAENRSHELATQPFKTQPSTPPDIVDTTKPKRPKLSAAPTDSLANSNNTRTSPRTSPRKSAIASPQRVIEIDDGDGGGKSNLNSTMEGAMENVSEIVDPKSKATPNQPASSVSPQDTVAKDITPSIDPVSTKNTSQDSRPSTQEKSAIGKGAQATPEKVPQVSIPKAATQDAPDNPQKESTRASKVQGVETPEKGSASNVESVGTDSSRRSSKRKAGKPAYYIESGAGGDVPEKDNTAESVSTENTGRSGKRKKAKASSLESVGMEEASSGALSNEASLESKKGKTPKATKAKKKKTGSAASEVDNASPPTSAAPKSTKDNKKKKAAGDDEASTPPKKKAKKGKSAKAKKSSQSGEAKPSDSSTVASKVTASSATSTSVSDSDKASKPAVVEVKKSAKKKKRSFQDQLLHKMFMSCKPYTVKILAQEMKSNESSVLFCMLSLTDKGWVVKKEFTSKGGRSKELYWANQTAKSKELYDALRIVPPHELHATKEEFATLQQEEKELANQLMQVVTDGPSNKDLETLLTTAQQQVTQLEKKLEETHARIREANSAQKPAGLLSKGRKQPPTKKRTPKSLKIRINKMRDEWRKRKNKCVDFIDQLADGMEKKVKDVVKLLELDTDESEGVKMPPKHEIE